MKITVLIPTYRRPALLRSTLASVRHQSRLDLISEVIVSENSEDRDSLSVAAEFPELPIRHIIQDPPTPAGLHISRLLEHGDSDWVALLADDDIWGRYHLEEAARCLDKNPTSTAYVAQDAIIRDDSRIIHAGHQRGLALALSAAKRKTFADYWILEKPDMAVACLASTPLNIWGLVAKRDTVKNVIDATSGVEPGHDSDRYMFWLLAKQTPVVAGREVSMFYRVHDNNAQNRMLRENPKHHLAMSAEFTRRILADASNLGIDLKTAWLNAIQTMDISIRQQYWRNAIPGAKQVIREAWPDEIKRVLPDPKQESRLKTVARDVSPPFIWRQLTRAKNATTGERPIALQSDV